MKYGRPPQLKMEDNLTFFQMEVDFKCVLSNVGSLFFVCNILSTHLYEIWNKTSMGDDLNFLKIEDDLKYLKMEDDITFNGGQPYFL